MIEAQGIRLEARGDRLRYFPAALLTIEMLAELGEHKAEILAELAQRKQPVADIPEVCPVCLEPVLSVVSSDGASELFGCHDSSGEQRHKWIGRKLPSVWSEIVIPEPLPIDITARCYNSGCPAIVTFKQGRGFCPRCGVFQRIVE